MDRLEDPLPPGARHDGLREFRAAASLPAPVDEALAWHRRAGAFERMSPPWEAVRVLERTGGIEPGARVTLETAVGPARLRWELEHRESEGGTGFADVQTHGPFASWRHDHLFFETGAAACRLEDRIRFALPARALTSWAEDAIVRPRLQRLFSFRHRTLAGDLAAHASARATPRLHVLISGASGLVGRTFTSFLSTGGHSVTRLVRAGSREAGAEPTTLQTMPSSDSPALEWNPARGFADPEVLAPYDAIVHLAGQNLASGLWTPEQKRRIVESRVVGTKSLAEAISRLRRPPMFLCASGIGAYGERGDDILDETEPPGAGFLADLTREWERAGVAALEAGARVVWMRLGVVVSGKDGAIPKMATPFRFGVGGPLGNGRAYLSWVALDDVLGAFHHALVDDRLSGPVNVVAPSAVTNAELTRTLAKVLHRPAFFRVPASLLRLLLGEMAQEMLLTSTRAVPKKLLETGYKFRHPEFEGALRHEFGIGARSD